MLNRIQAVYRYIKAEKARSNALVEEGRQIMGWQLRQKPVTQQPMDSSPLALQTNGL
jgi:hypothetical protein